MDCAVTLATYSQRHLLKWCKLFCGFFAWNMLEYVMLWCSVSCVPLCKGVRCARLCTLFSSRCCLTCLKCITLSCDCQQKTFDYNYVSLQCLNTLLFFFVFVEFILSHVCVFVNDFWKLFLKLFSCVFMSFWHWI